MRQVILEVEVEVVALDRLQLRVTNVDGAQRGVGQHRGGDLVEARSCYGLRVDGAADQVRREFVARLHGREEVAVVAVLRVRRHRDVAIGVRQLLVRRIGRVGFLPAHAGHDVQLVDRLELILRVAGVYVFLVGVIAALVAQHVFDRCAALRDRANHGRVDRIAVLIVIVVESDELIGDGVAKQQIGYVVAVAADVDMAIAQPRADAEL